MNKMNFASELVGAVIGSQFGSAVPNSPACRLECNTMTTSPSLQPATLSQDNAPADAPTASGLINGSLKGHEGGRVAVHFKARRVGELARQIDPYGRFYRGPVWLWLEVPKMAPKA